MLLGHDEYGSPRRRMVTKNFCVVDLLLLLAFLFLLVWPVLHRLLFAH